MKLSRLGIKYICVHYDSQTVESHFSLWTYKSKELGSRAFPILPLAFEECAACWNCPSVSGSNWGTALLCRVCWYQCRNVQPRDSIQAILRTVIWKSFRFWNQDFWLWTSVSSHGNSSWVQLLYIPRPR